MSDSPTINELVMGIEVELEAAKRRRDKAKAEVKLILDSASGENRSNLTAQEDARVTELFAVIDRASEDADGIKGKLSRALKIQAEELESDRLANTVRPGAPAPGSPEVEYRADSQGAFRPVGNASAMYGAGSTAATPQFKRASDGRNAAVARDVRLRDSEFGREEMARISERDRIIEGQHGNMAQWLRSISTTSWCRVDGPDELVAGRD